MEDHAAMNGSKNQSVIFCGYRGEIVLDITTTFTYHTQAFATGLTSVPTKYFTAMG